MSSFRRSLLMRKATENNVIPADPVFGNNDWATIAAVFRAGQAALNWSVGDTKTITTTDSITLTVRIVDMKTGRYTYVSDNSNTHGVFEIVQVYPTAANYYAGKKTTITKPNGTTTTSYSNNGWANCDIRSNYAYNTSSGYLPKLPSDLRAVLEDVYVYSGAGSSNTTPTSSANKVFLPAETELFSSNTYSLGNAQESNALGQFEYYAAHNTASDRIKRKPDNTACRYWLRSPVNSGSTNWVAVETNGSILSLACSTTSNMYLSTCFAL